MILLRIQGGLGNQLFQYAAARQLSLRLNTKLYIDPSSYSNDDYGRTYGLNMYNIEAEMAPEKMINNWRSFTSHYRIQNFTSRLSSRLPKSLRFHNLIEYEFQPYNVSFSKFSGFIILNGYFQSPHYFDCIADIIRKDLILTQEPSKESKCLSAVMHECNSISIHVRRADYITHPGASQLFEVLSKEYYRLAMELLTEQVVNPRIFVFSDDINWCRKNLTFIVDTTFVDHEGAHTDYEALWLMSQCKHHIIANSSFSWWGAWLGNNPAKLIVAPKTWFIDKTMIINDLIPSDWNTL